MSVIDLATGEPVLGPRTSRITPMFTADGRLVWTADREDTRRLLIGTPGALAQAEPVTPPGLQVRAVIDVDGDTVLFQASAEPAEIGLWAYGPDGLHRVGAEETHRQDACATKLNGRTSRREASARTRCFSAA